MDGRQPWRTLGEALVVTRTLLLPETHELLTSSMDSKSAIEKLTDHSHECVLNQMSHGWNMKVEHPFMGCMSFPDDTKKPACTIVATQLV